MKREEYRNVYCVGRNYAEHAKELGNSVPKSPLIFLKPSHAIVPMEGELTLPAGVGEIHHEAELVLHVAKAYTPGARVEELIDRIGLGLDFTLRDVQSELKKQGQPWLPAKGFRGSAPLTALFPFPGTERTEAAEFSLRKNGETVQRGFARDMIFPLRTIIDFIGNQYGLGAGDLIFTGTPSGVGKVEAGDRLELYWEGALLGASTVRLQ
ncbi:fumarylacetoacetate hydrolase family protein [Paenibacillus thermotolerans]|uniref:fumarylacetoacetate hydrolase family protein n=1 Tax=Paenibacillus thermotolerans TaxID=3027807 RepID=UPI002368DDD5|nr:MULTISPECIES: fumarylacetoacetate hydrolase family protein [unclassified Paenibacillus]